MLRRDGDELPHRAEAGRPDQLRLRVRGDGGADLNWVLDERHTRTMAACRSRRCRGVIERLCRVPFGRRHSDIHAFPDNYKADILGAMHAYLNDPSGIRDAAIAAPVLKDVPGSGTRYIVCLRFNGKQSNGTYAGEQQIAAVFLAGRFDEFVDAKTAHEPCAGAAYAPFPELEQLKR